MQESIEGLIFDGAAAELHLSARDEEKKKLELESQYAGRQLKSIACALNTYLPQYAGIQYLSRICELD